MEVKKEGLREKWSSKAKMEVRGQNRGCRKKGDLRKKYRLEVKMEVG